MGRWEVADDLSEVVELNISLNRGLLYEIFWQYTLTVEELERQKARAWVYIDGSRETGLALTRKIGALTTIEELWGEK